MKELDPRLKMAIQVVVVTGVLFALVAGTKFGGRAGFSVAVGSSIAASNLYVMARIIDALVSPGASKSVAGWSVAFGLKLLLLFGGIWLLLTWQVVSALPLAIGYGTLPIGIAIGSLVSDKAGHDSARPR
jgi:hypothetical protein